MLVLSPGRLGPSWRGAQAAQQGPGQRERGCGRGAGCLPPAGGKEPGRPCWQEASTCLPSGAQHSFPVADSECVCARAGVPALHSCPCPVEPSPDWPTEGGAASALRATLSRAFSRCSGCLRLRDNRSLWVVGGRGRRTPTQVWRLRTWGYHRARGPCNPSHVFLTNRTEPMPSESGCSQEAPLCPPPAAPGRDAGGVIWGPMCPPLSALCTRPCRHTAQARTAARPLAQVGTRLPCDTSCLEEQSTCLSRAQGERTPTPGSWASGPGPAPRTESWPRFPEGPPAPRAAGGVGGRK